MKKSGKLGMEEGDEGRRKVVRKERTGCGSKKRAETYGRERNI